MTQANPVSLTGKQVNAKAINLAGAVIGKIAELLLHDDNWRPERLEALAHILDACANDYDPDDGE